MNADSRLMVGKTRSLCDLRVTDFLHAVTSSRLKMLYNPAAVLAERDGSINTAIYSEADRRLN
jgi:hypothetical protein